MSKMKEEELKIRSQGYSEGIRFTAYNYSAVVLLCLKDKFDFTTEQLKDASLHINNTFTDICEGYLNLTDIVKNIRRREWYRTYIQW